jgi:hypothetical protein
VDLGRLHADRSVPLLGLHRALRGRLTAHTGRRAAAVGRGELHPELRQGRRRWVQRVDLVLRHGAGGSDHPGVVGRVPEPLHTDRGGADGAAGALPVPGEPLPGPGRAVHELPRHRFGRVLREAGLLGASGGPDCLERNEPVLDAPVLPADALAGRGGGVLRTDPSVHPSEPTEHGRVDGGEVRPRIGLRAAHQLPVPGRCQRRRADPDLLAHQPGRALLRRTHPARSGRIVHRVRGFPRDPA